MITSDNIGKIKSGLTRTVPSKGSISQAHGGTDASEDPEGWTSQAWKPSEHAGMLRAWLDAQREAGSAS